ncbi:MAG: hypothetical protein GY757_46920, partial [bacterium]|nr:hypothetical protein [bacterium]
MSGAAKKTPGAKGHLIKLRNPEIFSLDIAFIYVSQKGFRLVVLYDEQEHVSQIHPIIDNVLKLF